LKFGSVVEGGTACVTEGTLRHSSSLGEGLGSEVTYFNFLHSKKFGAAWATIAERLRNGGILTGEEQKRLEHEALRKIAYLKELKERGKESANIKLHLLEEHMHSNRPPPTEAHT